MYSLLIAGLIFTCSQLEVKDYPANLEAIYSQHVESSSRFGFLYQVYYQTSVATLIS